MTLTPPQALSLIYDYLKARNIDGEAGKSAIEFFRKIDKVFGVFRFEHKEVDDIREIERLIEQRNALRKAKRYEEADQVRDRLTQMGVKLYDHEGQTKWRKAE